MNVTDIFNVSDTVTNVTDPSVNLDDSLKPGLISDATRDTVLAAYTWLMPALSVLTITFCLLNAWVYWQQRAARFALYLVAVDVGDGLCALMTLCGAAAVFSLPHDHLNRQVIWFYLSTYLAASYRRAAVCLNLLACVERFLAIAFPLRTMSRKVLGKPVLTAVVVFVVCLAGHSYLLLEYHVTRKASSGWEVSETEWGRDHSEVFVVVAAFSNVAFAYFPLVVILVLNITLLLVLRAHAARRRYLGVLLGDRKNPGFTSTGDTEPQQPQNFMASKLRYLRTPPGHTKNTDLPSIRETVSKPPQNRASKPCHLRTTPGDTKNTDLPSTGDTEPNSPQSTAFMPCHLGTSGHTQNSQLSFTMDTDYKQPQNTVPRPRDLTAPPEDTNNTDLPSTIDTEPKPSENTASRLCYLRTPLGDTKSTNTRDTEHKSSQNTPVERHTKSESSRTSATNSRIQCSERQGNKTSNPHTSKVTATSSLERCHARTRCQEHSRLDQQGPRSDSSRPMIDKFHYLNIEKRSSRTRRLYTSKAAGTLPDECSCAKTRRQQSSFKCLFHVICGRSGKIRISNSKSGEYQTNTKRQTIEKDWNYHDNSGYYRDIIDNRNSKSGHHQSGSETRCGKTARHDQLDDLHCLHVEPERLEDEKCRGSGRSESCQGRNRINSDQAGLDEKGGHRNSSEVHDQKSKGRQDNHVTKLVIIFTTVFFLLALPDMLNFTVASLLSDYGPQGRESNLYTTVSTLALIISHLTEPSLFWVSFAFSRHFRSQVSRLPVARWCFCCLKNVTSVSENNISRSAGRGSRAAIDADSAIP